MELQAGKEEQVVGSLSIVDWVRSASLSDLLTDDGHSTDFGALRAEYLSLRVRLLAFLFAGLAPLWIPIDYLYLNHELFLSFFAMRLAFAGLFLWLGMWSGRPGSRAAARLRVFAFLAIPGAFYVSSRLLISDLLVFQAEILIGYSFLPFLMVALLAIFPLTLVEGLASIGGVFAFVVGFELYTGDLTSIPVMADLWLLGLLGAIALWAELTQLHMLLRLYREATRDPLTRLVNRRVLNRWLATEMQQAEAESRPLSVLLFDLDLFKRINDNYGHLVGDTVLRAFGDLLHKEATTPLVGRYGGEEFLAILPGVEAGEALAVAERIRQGCRALRVPAGEGQLVRFTTSVGVAELMIGEDADGLIRRVDKGLYQAKEGGRDLVALAD